jgi:outer membrane protein
VLRDGGDAEDRVNAAAILLAGTLTLQQAASEALSRNPAVAAAEAQREIATARVAETRAGRLPRVDLTESATRGNNPVFVFGSLLEQGVFGARHFDPAFLNDPDPLTSYRAALTARVPVFDRLATSTAIAQGRNGVGRAAAELEETRQRLRSETVARYYGVLVAREKLAVAQEAVTGAEADAKAARDRFEQGLLVESDALSADVQLAFLRQRVIAAEGELAIARAALATLLQRPRTETIDVEGGLPDAPAETSLDDAIARATSQRAPVKSAASVAADAALRLKGQRATALPRVDAFGTFGATGGTFGDRDSDHTIGVALTLELFDRGRSARIAAARGEIDAARAGEALARDGVTMEVVTAWHRLRAAREMSAVAATAAERAEAASRIVRDRYGVGLTTITEQLRAQTALVSARFDHLAARYDALVAQAELLRATGDLNDFDDYQ